MACRGGRQAPCATGVAFFRHASTQTAETLARADEHDADAAAVGPPALSGKQSGDHPFKNQEWKREQAEQLEDQEPKHDDYPPNESTRPHSRSMSENARRAGRTTNVQHGSVKRINTEFPVHADD